MTTWNERRQRIIDSAESVQANADAMFPNAPINDALRLFLIGSLARFILDTVSDVSKHTTRGEPTS